MKLRALAQITYFVSPEQLTEEERLRLADLLSGYAADLRQGAATGRHYVQFEIADA